MVWLAGLIWAMATERVLRDETLTVRFDAVGNLVALSIRGKPIALQPSKLPISLRVDGQWWHDNPPPLQPVHQRVQRNRADIAFRAGDFVLTVHYELPKGGILLKRVTVRYEGDGQPRIDGALFWLPAVALGNDAVVLSPSFDFLRVPVTTRPRFNIDMGTGVWCALFSPQQRRGLAATFYSDTEHYSVNADSLDISAPTVHSSLPALRIHHWLGVQDRASKGWVAELGTQMLVAAEGDEQAVLTKLWDAYDALGVRVPADTPKDVFDGAFYSTWSDYRNLQRLLPHLRRIGVRTIWLLPYTPGVYAPLDYYAIRPELGTPDDLKALVSEAHRLGMRVLLDLIPHGPRPESELGKAQRVLLDAGQDSWICTDERGQPIHWWGCYAFDYAHPGWIAYMAEVAAHFAREFGIDGWRVDVAGGGPPNWSVVKQPLPRRRPSQSGLWGGLRIIDEARKAVKRVRGDAVFYPEASGAPFVVHGDFDYGFPFYFAAMRWMDLPADEFAPKLRRWLHHQRFSFPKGGAKRIVRWLENHDFPDAKGRLGTDALRALFAVAAFSEGVPFVFEHQDTGLTEFVSKVMRLRSALTELRDGDADYLSPQVSDDRVFAVHRFHRQRHTVVLVNLSGEPLSLQVRLPSAMASWQQVSDGWHGRSYRIQKGAIALSLAPFDLAVLTDDARARQFAQRKAQPYAAKPCPVDFSDDGMLRIGEHVLGQWHEGAFKIALGEPLPFEATDVQRDDKSATGKLVLKRRMGAVVRRVAEIHWRWQQSEKGGTYEAHWRLLLPLKLAQHDLGWQFLFRSPLRWRIATAEGVMDEPMTVRQTQPQLLWDSLRIPPSLTNHPLSVQLPDGCWWSLKQWQGSNLQVWLHPDGTLLVRILPDEQGTLSFTFSLDEENQTASPSKTFAIAAESARLLLSTPSLQLAVARYKGGLPAWLKVRSPKSKSGAGSEWQKVLAGSELYSDYGIFPDQEEGGAWRAEGERRLVRAVGRASACRYPDRVTISSNGAAFEGALATAWGGHWWHLNPRINYQLRYEREGDGIVVQAKVAPVKPLRKVRAFLAFTLTFVGATQVTVNTVKGWHTVPEIGERDWQSRQLPLAPNGEICVHTPFGTVALQAIEGELQNCFVLKDGDRCTVFFAWLDGEETDFSDWRSLRFRIVHRKP